jgi:hypothetical protein
VLSDANTVFISHILAGARVAGLVDDVVTNLAIFERVTLAAPGLQPGGAGEGAAAVAALGSGGGSSNSGCGAGAVSNLNHLPHKLVVHAAHGGPGGGKPGHSCSMCPDNLCKGREVS